MTVSTSLGFTVTPVSLKIFRTVSSKLLFGILSGIPKISNHSRLEYCSFAGHFLSRMRFCFTKLSFTLLVTKSCDSIFVNLSLNPILGEGGYFKNGLQHGFEVFSLLIFIIWGHSLKISDPYLYFCGN